MFKPKHRIACGAQLAFALGAWLALAGALAGVPRTALAEAPMVRTQAPGWYRQMVGDFEVTVLLDGTTKLPVKDILTHAKPKEVDSALKNGFLPRQVETSVNAFLVNTGAKLVLIDTGSGGFFGPKPQLIPNMRAAGYQPEQVDEVYITHMHGDHVGGLAAGEQRAFPNAVLRVDQHDADFWLSEEVMNRAPAQFRDFFKSAMAAVKPYKAAGKFQPFEGPLELVPGVRAVPAHGHTPGHTVYLVQSKGETLALWGDLMHVASVQFDDPSVTVTFDTDEAKAAAARAKVYAEAAKNGWMVGAAHIAFPGLGHVRRSGSAKGRPAYTWVPVNYSSLQAQ